MCGIAGIIASDRLQPHERVAMPAMLHRLRHRGPDGDGIHRDDHAILGHRRLAVIDLAGGRQPLPDETGRHWSVVNGEFYDHPDLRARLIERGHRFATGSDSECLVHLYEDRGDDCLNELDGMFALALWDAPRRRALLARDRLGVKPLYYHVNNRRLVFASELKAILAAPDVPRTIDPTALLDYLTFGFIPAPRTVYRNIYKLPAGCALTYEHGRATVRAYWDLKHAGHIDTSDDALAEAIWAQLRVATRKRLIADVPIGAFLSGGLDSAAVVSAMAQITRQRITTLTCGFDERNFDERIHAARIAGLFGAVHHETTVRPDAAALLDELAWHFDEPFADPSAVPMYLLSRRARRHMTVALSGDGGDEALAGYRRYRFDRNEERVRRLLPPLARRGLFSPLAAIYPSSPKLPRVLRAGRTLRNLALDGASAHATSIATTDPTLARTLLAGDVAEAAGDHDPLDHARTLYRRCDAPDHLSKCQYVDIRLGLADGILTKVDRASMAHGLEVRSPMLDYRFLEFAWTIPPSRRIRGPHGKAPLRRAVRRHLGDALPVQDRRRHLAVETALRGKHGFDVPLDAWFRGPLRERMDAAMRDSDLATCINPHAARALVDRHERGEIQAGPTLWKILTLAAWLDRIHGGCGETPRAITEDALCIP